MNPRLGCPPWCAVDHSMQAGHEAAEQAREHATRPILIPDLNRGNLQVVAARWDDLETGRPGRVVVALGDQELSGAQARLLAAALIVTADIIDGEPR